MGIPMGIWSIHCSWHWSCPTYFCWFPLALANICPWPLVPFFQISLKNREQKTTYNTFWDRRVHFFRYGKCWSKNSLFLMGLYTCWAKFFLVTYLESSSSDIWSSSSSDTVMERDKRTGRLILCPSETQGLWGLESGPSFSLTRTWSRPPSLSSRSLEGRQGKYLYQVTCMLWFDFNLGSNLFTFVLGYGYEWKWV